MTHTFTLLKRALILVSGPDRFSFLQGLITQDIEKLNPFKSLYSLLLTPQGRFLYDFFLVSANLSNSSFFIECDALAAPDLLKRLSLYKLRSQVTLQPLENAHVFAYWPLENSSPNTLFLSEGLLSYPDPRLSNLGGRLISLFSAQEGQDFLVEKRFQEASFEAYQEYLLLQGVPNSSQKDMIFEKSIPLECGMEELQALSWTKGCYLGQELTARTKYQGLVRKRLIPGRLEGALCAPFNSTLLFDGKEAGSLRSSKNGYAMALVRLEFLECARTSKLPFEVHPASSPQEKAPSSLPILFKPFLPSWMQLPKNENDFDKESKSSGSS